MKKQNELKIVCGIPGSGKSTWIKDHKRVKDIVISLDDIRKNIFGTQFFKPSEPWVIAIAKSMVMMLQNQNKDLIIDSTNYNSSMRKTWINLVHSGYKIILVHIDTPEDICLKRNKTRPKSDRVPYEVLNNFIHSFVPPSPRFDVYHKLIVVKDYDEK